MVKILFVCHGNICRSPMAEFIFKDLIAKAGLEKKYIAASAATSAEELGNPVYPPARRRLAEHGISCAGKTARQMVRGDYRDYDLLLGMDGANLRNMRRIAGGDPEGKIRLLMDYTPRPRDVADPWYTGDFDTAWDDLTEGCQALLRALEGEGRGSPPNSRALT
ncbi:MAG: low molecular weight phosphotyrosine protein phosphatase [Oscillospiraceae bacterium]|nr:low molecular weight phosphotyrosine protein phosphatase [Oscillospiraceae bacterium]